MGLARVCTRWFNLISLFILLQTVVSAQELPARVAGVSPIPSVSTVTADTSTALQSAADVMYGKGTKGPYYLSWKPVSRMTDRVIVDGTYMQRGVDYNIDYNTSMIAFTSSVDALSTIRVEYSYPTGASKNSSPLNVPLSLNLLKRDNSELKVLGLYKQGDQNAKKADTLAYGLAGSTKLGISDISSMILFSPETPGSNSDGSFNDRSAIKLGSSTKTDNLQFNASYLMVGEQFDAAKDYQLQQGLQAMDYSAILNAKWR